MGNKKVIATQLPRQANPEAVEVRYSYELESLADVGEILEIQADGPADFGAKASQADALITSWGTVINHDVISQLEKCVVIGVGSVGVDMVDVDAATQAGIVVTNTPDIFIEETADHAFALFMAAARRLPVLDAMCRTEGQWFKGRPIFDEIPRLWGQTMAIAGFGNVARAFARRAQPFGMHVIAYDPFVSELTMTAEGVEPISSLGELLERADYLSLHPALNDETRHMIDAEAFDRMKDSAVLINAGRGPLVDEVAMNDALNQGKIAFAAVDVLEQEPPAPDNPLLSNDRIIITPHAASATSRMRPETRRRVGREISLVLAGKWPRSCVNPTVLPRVELERWQPYPMERGPNR